MVRKLIWTCLSPLVGVCGLHSIPTASADVQDLMVADVTTRAVSVIWASDQPLVADEVSVRVFASDENDDPAEEITDLLTVELLSDADALGNGVVKIDVVGLLADTLYYVSAHTEHQGGESFVLPATGLLFPVETAAGTTKVSAVSQGAITNDIINY